MIYSKHIGVEEFRALMLHQRRMAKDIGDRRGSEVVMKVKFSARSEYEMPRICTPYHVCPNHPAPGSLHLFFSFLVLRLR